VRGGLHVTSTWNRAINWALAWTSPNHVKYIGPDKQELIVRTCHTAYQDPLTTLIYFVLSLSLSLSLSLAFFFLLWVRVTAVSTRLRIKKLYRPPPCTYQTRGQSNLAKAASNPPATPSMWAKLTPPSNTCSLVPQECSPSMILICSAVFHSEAALSRVTDRLTDTAIIRSQ